MKYYLGQKFLSSANGEIYRLVQHAEGLGILIGEKTHNRWNDYRIPLKCDDDGKLYTEETQLPSGFTPMEPDRLEEGLNELCKDLVTATIVLYVRGRIEEAIATEACVNLLMETCRLKRPLTETEKVKIIYG